MTYIPSSRYITLRFVSLLCLRSTLRLYNSYLFNSCGGFRTRFRQFQRLSIMIFRVLSTSFIELFSHGI